MVITSLTRNQVVEQSAREFESHRLRHEPVCGQCPQQALPFFEPFSLYWTPFREHRFARHKFPRYCRSLFPRVRA